MSDPAINPEAKPEANPLNAEQQEAANFARILENIKRDDGTQKFDKVDTALESIQPKDDHIKNIEAENAKLKEDIAKFGSQEEILKKFLENRTPAEEAQPASEPLDKGTVNEMLAELLDKRDADNIAQVNVRKVAQALADTYGDKATEVMTAKAKEMGISEDFLKDIIAKSPEAGFELLDLKPVDKAPANLSGSQNAENFNKAVLQKPKSVLGNMFITHTDVKECWDACHPDKYMD